MINAPSLLNCDLLHLGEDVAELVAAGVDTFHVDLMDGHQVPALAFPPSVVADLKRAHPSCTVDAHLMVTDPERWVEPLAAYGADWFSFPSAATPSPADLVARIRAAGMRAGAVIDPSQPVDAIAPYAHLLDLVVLMTVEPGSTGQPFLAGSLERLEHLATLLRATGSAAVVEIDGGVTWDLAPQLLTRGAQVLVTGVYVTFAQPGGIADAVTRFADAMAGVEVEPRFAR